LRWLLLRLRQRRSKKHDCHGGKNSPSRHWVSSLGYEHIKNSIHLRVPATRSRFVAGQRTGMNAGRMEQRIDAVCGPIRPLVRVLTLLRSLAPPTAGSPPMCDEKSNLRRFSASFAVRLRMNVLSTTPEKR
jgi:hypothetical protein